MPERRPYMTDAAADALIASALDGLFDAERGLPPASTCDGSFAKLGIAVMA